MGSSDSKLAGEAHPAPGPVPTADTGIARLQAITVGHARTREAFRSMKPTPARRGRACAPCACWQRGAQVTHEPGLCMRTAGAALGQPQCLTWSV